jgi:hypothetical protein
MLVIRGQPSPGCAIAIDGRCTSSEVVAVDTPVAPGASSEAKHYRRSASTVEMSSWDVAIGSCHLRSSTIDLSRVAAEVRVYPTPVRSRTR